MNSMFRLITGYPLSRDADESSISEADSRLAKRIDYKGFFRYVSLNILFINIKRITQ
jgi:hypothetical protein